VKFPQEIVVESFLPTFRSMLASDLRERGLTQSEVAAQLGISQSAVSKYAHGEVSVDESVAEAPRVRRLVERVGTGLAAGEMSRVEALGETLALVRQLEDRDLVCQLHEAEMPALAGLGCDFCVRGADSQLRETERVLSSVRRGLNALETTSGFTSLVPAVGSNLCECLPDAESIDDVAGVPGRIVDVKGRTTIPAGPEFGVSEHVASVLLAARAHGSDARAALNVRYDPDLLADLREMGLPTVEFDADYDDGGAALEATLVDAPDADVLYHTGGFGIEPIVYLLGADAEAVAETARQLV
jgi:predicted fused transcriptional regulator/phosphomethylpyrimidine kinase/predicted transcriptional regulator